MDDQDETREYKVTGSPELLDRFEGLLSQLHYAGAVGHTGTFGMDLDGDGPERLTIEPDLGKLDAYWPDDPDVRFAVERRRKELEIATPVGKRSAIARLAAAGRARASQGRQGVLHHNGE